MLENSKIYNFIDNDNGFSLHFFDGQKLIQDLILFHKIRGQGLDFYRDCVLSLQPLLFFLKPGEGIGFYLKSRSPEFMFNVEMNYQGHFRALFLPDVFDQFPETITGECRIVKTLPSSSKNYTSILKLEDQGFHEIINQSLKESYQIEGFTHISNDADQSLFINRLPDVNFNQYSRERRPSLDEYWRLMGPELEKIYKSCISGDTKVIESFEKLNYQYLGGKEVTFSCDCSKARFLDILQKLPADDKKSLYDDDQNEIEIKCDYCQKIYHIQRKDLLEN